MDALNEAYVGMSEDAFADLNSWMGEMSLDSLEHLEEVEVYFTGELVIYIPIVTKYLGKYQFRLCVMTSATHDKPAFGSCFESLGKQRWLSICLVDLFMGSVGESFQESLTTIGQRDPRKLNPHPSVIEICRTKWHCFFGFC